MGWLESKEETDAWRTASLRFLEGRLIFCSTIWPSQNQVDQAVTKLEETRAWCASIGNPRMKKECLSWCDFSEREIGKAKHELRTKEGQIKHNEWLQKNAENNTRVATILNSIRPTRL